MNWINIHTNTLRSPEFVGSEPVSRSTWLSVLAYCTEQENGGVIANCREWKDRQWQQICGVTSEEVNNADALLFWEGDNLSVWNYPLEKEAEIKTKRDAGKAGGIRSGEARTKLSFKHNRSSASSIIEAQLEAETKLTLNGKERNRKGIGKEGELERNVPPNPQNENGEELRASLGGDEDSETPKPNQNKNIPTTEPSLRIAELFSRRKTTAWSDKEIRVFKKLGEIQLPDLDMIEDYYESERAKGDGKDGGKHRRDLYTFLNNFQGELDRARAFTPQPTQPARKIYPSAEDYIEMEKSEENMKKLEERDAIIQQRLAEIKGEL